MSPDESLNDSGRKGLDTLDQGPRILEESIGKLWKDAFSGCNKGLKVVAGRILHPGIERAEPRRGEEVRNDGSFERQDTALWADWDGGGA